MSQRDPGSPLHHMLDYALKAVRFCENKSLPELEADEVLQLALVRALELIGEAATRVPEETRETLPSIPWHEITGTRNRLIHGYDRIDLRIVWDTIQDDLPPLILKLQAALPQE